MEPTYEPLLSNTMQNVSQCLLATKTERILEVLILTTRENVSL